MTFKKLFWNMDWVDAILLGLGVLYAAQRFDGSITPGWVLFGLLWTVLLYTCMPWFPAQVRGW